MSGWEPDKGFRIVGNVNGCDVYTKGVTESTRDDVISTWMSLPKRENLWDELVDAGSRGGCWAFDNGGTWLNFAWDSWGASYIYGEDEKAAITATIGHHGGFPVMLEIICDTGDAAGPDDVPDYIEGLCEIVLQALQDDCPVDLGEHGRW